MIFWERILSSAVFIRILRRVCRRVLRFLDHHRYHPVAQFCNWVKFYHLQKSLGCCYNEGQKPGKTRTLIREKPLFRNRRAPLFRRVWLVWGVLSARTLGRRRCLPRRSVLSLCWAILAPARLSFEAERPVQCRWMLLDAAEAVLKNHLNFEKYLLPV